MAIKFVHIRETDPDGNISSFGGVTVAYTIVDTSEVGGICLNLAKCRSDDRFQFKIGREIAARKLHDNGPLEVLPLDHPISEVIVDWLANTWWPEQPTYGGYAVDIYPDHKNRWLSDFTPSQEEVDFIADEDLLRNIQRV